MGARVAGVLSVPRGNLCVAADEQVFELPSSNSECRQPLLDDEPDMSVTATHDFDEQPGYVPRQRKLVMMKKRA